MAAICLGKMEHAAGARALRQITSVKGEDKDVQASSRDQRIIPSFWTKGIFTSFMLFTSDTSDASILGGLELAALPIPYEPFLSEVQISNLKKICLDRFREAFLDLNCIIICMCVLMYL